MKIRYIAGRAGKGKTFLVLSEIKQHIQKNWDGNLVLLVPEQYTLQAERDLIYKMNLPGIIDVDVLSFTRLAHKVLNEVGGLTRIHLNDQGKNMILRKLIDEAEKEFLVYKKAADRDGFLTMVSDLICELKQHDISPALIREQLMDLDPGTIIYKKLHDIAIMYERFNAYLQGRYIDSEDYINLLIEKIAQATFLRKSKIWIDGFTSFTPQIYRIIEKLMTLAEEVTITLTLELSKANMAEDVFKITEQTYEKIQEIARFYGISGEVIDLDKEPMDFDGKALELRHVEKELFSYPYGIFEKSTEKIAAFSAMNPYSEIEHTASKIVSLVRDKGYRWKDIAVICNDIENYGMVMKRVFEEYGIPFFMDQKRSIMHNPIVETVLSSLWIIHRGFRYEDIFRFLKAGFSGIDGEAYEALENYALQHGLRGSSWKEPFVIGDELELGELNECRKKLVEPLIALEKKIKKKGYVGAMTEALFEYLNTIKVSQQLEEWIETLRQEGAYEYVSENAQIWNIVMDIFDQLVEIIGDQVISLKEYIRLLESGFESIELGIIPTTIDQVLVGTIQRSKSHDIKGLFAVGVNDGVLPSKKEEAGLLADDAKALLKERGVELYYDNEYRAYQEKYNIYSAFSKPMDYLWISYAMADQEGKALRPSMLVDRFKKIFKAIVVESDVSTQSQDHRLICTPGSTFKYMTQNFRMKAEGKNMQEMWWKVYKWYAQNHLWNSRINAMLEGLFHQNQVDYIQTHYTKRLYATPIRSRFGHSH